MQASPPRVAPAGIARHGSKLGSLRSGMVSILMALRFTRSKSTRSNVAPAVPAGARTARIAAPGDHQAASSGFGRKKRAGYLDRGKRPRDESEQQQQRRRRYRTRSGRVVSWLSLRLAKRASRHAAIPDHTHETEAGHQLSRMLDQSIQLDEPKAPKATAHDRLYRGSTRTTTQTESELSNRKSSAVSRKSSAKPRRSSALARMSSAWG